MENPSPINLKTSDEIRKDGWAAEARDNDGHLCSSHAAFETQGEMLDYINECLASGHHVTIFADEVATRCLEVRRAEASAT